MIRQIIKSQSILPRIDGIQSDLEKLRPLKQLSLSDFSQETNFVLAKYYLREALEGVFHIGSHILSRLPAGRATGYKEIAIKLGELGIVEKNIRANQTEKYGRLPQPPDSFLRAGCTGRDL